MSEQEFDRTLAQWLETEARPANTADVLDRALGATRRRRPRSRLYASVGSHWVGNPVGSASKVAPLGRAGLRPSMALLWLVLLLAVALVAGAVLVGARLLQPAPDIGRLGHLAYTMEDGLYVADWDGRNPRRIISLGELPGPDACRAFFAAPAWSPDGRHLAVRTVWNDDCPGSVVITDAEGSAAATIPGAGWQLSWSPDSSRIVTWLAFGETIGIYGIDGARQAVLAAPSTRVAAGDHDPSWMPDGSAIQLPYGVVVPLDGSAPSLDPRFAFRRGSSISPDGTRIASPEGASIVVAASDGSSQRVLGSIAPSDITDVRWSPTGDRIAFRHGTGLGSVDVGTGATTSLEGLPGEFGINGFSPSGDRFLLATFASVAADGRSALWVVEAGGSSPRKIVDGTQDGSWQLLPPRSETVPPPPGPTTLPRSSANPTSTPAARVVLPACCRALGWSRDGTRLLMLRPDGNLSVLRADGSETQLTEQPAGIERLLGSSRPSGATISPDGSRVVFAGVTRTDRSCHDGALFTVSADGGPAELFWTSQSTPNRGPSGGIVRDPTFSPDGGRIAFADGYCDSDHIVWVANADGSDAHPVGTPPEAGHVLALTWSQAGDRLTLVMDTGTYTFASDGSDAVEVPR